MGNQRYIILPGTEDSPNSQYIAFRMGDDREEEYRIGDLIGNSSLRGLNIFGGKSIDHEKYHRIVVIDGLITEVNEINLNYYEDLIRNYK